MVKRVWFVWVFLLLMGSLPAAGWIKLSNGDRVSGSVVRYDGEKLTLMSELIGEVVVPWEAVVEIETEEKIFLIDENGQVLVGLLGTSGEDFQVETIAGPTVRVSRASVTAIRSEAEQAAYLAEIERLRDPSLLDFWGGTVDAGLSFSRGNADTTTFTAGANVQRVTERDKISLYMTTIYAQNSTSGTSLVTANAIRGGTRYDIQLSGRMFGFGFADFEFDEFQNLDFRNVLGGGVGWTVAKSESTDFRVFGGGALNQEFFTNDLTRRSGELVLGEELKYRLSSNTLFNHKLSFFPNLSESGEYRLQFDAGLSTQLKDWLGWHVGLSDRFLSNPPFGVQQNDLLLSTGLRVSFGKK